MARAAKQPLAPAAVVAALLERHGQTYAEELGLKLARNTPAVLFRWLCATVLLSARIRAHVAMAAARALADRGWTTPARMARSSWAERTKVLNEAGYARYDESTSRKLGATVELLRSAYGGDLRKLREVAGAEPARERALLKDFNGIGEVGVDIFFREMQAVWPELYPFLDRRALQAARALGLPGEVEALAALVARQDLPRLGAALVRTSLAKDAKVILAAVRAG